MDWPSGASTPQGAEHEGSIVIQRHIGTRLSDPLFSFSRTPLHSPFVALTNLPAACTHKHTHIHTSFGGSVSRFSSDD